MKHLYVHIPFCNSICTYCDFVRFVSCNKEKEEYINKIIKQIKQKSKNNIYLTVYIGGGTPNSISDKLLTKLLKCIKKYINKKTEFTIELNPELITPSQASILKKYSVNRVSIGIQSVDSTILKKYNRSGNIEMYEKAIRTIKKTGIVNISCDFIYGFNEGDPEKQIIDDLEFLTKNNINHASFYSLEVKDNSIIAKQNYVIDEKRIDNQLLLIEKIMPKKGFERYEVSSWCKNKKYRSKHNIAYWKMEEWFGIGLGATGFSSKSLLENKGNLKKWETKIKKLNKKECYFYIIMMGLRMIDGIDLKIKNNLLAYKFFKKQLIKTKIENNHLKSTNIDKLNITLLKCLEKVEKE